MRDFLTIVKWRNRESIRLVTRQGARTTFVTVLAIAFLVMISVPLVLYMRSFFIPNFSRVAELSEQLKEFTGIDLKAIVVAFFSAIIFSILLGSDLPIIVSNLFFSDRVSMLLQMPVRKSTIAKVQLSEVLTAGGLPVILFVPVFLGALRGLGFSGLKFWFALVLLLVFVLNILAVTAIISFAVVFITKGRLLKTLSALMTMVTLFVFIFTLRFMDFSAIDLARPDQVTAQFSGLQKLITSPYLPWTPFVRAIMGETRDILVFILYSVSVFILLELLEVFVYPGVLQKLLTRPSGSRKISNRTIDGKSNAFFGIVRKDFLLLLREPKLTFAILYPSLFVPVVVIVNPTLLRSFGLLQLLGLIVFLFSNYTTVSSTALFAFERQLGDNSLLYPIKRLKTVISKVAIVSLIYSSIILMVGLYVASKASLYEGFILSFLVLMIPTIFSLSLLGGYLEKSFGTQDTSNVFKALSLAGAVLSFILSTILPVFSSLPFAMYISGSIGAFLAFLNLSPVVPWTWLFGLVIPITLWVGIVWASLRSLCYNFV